MKRRNLLQLLGAVVAAPFTPKVVVPKEVGSITLEQILRAKEILETSGAEVSDPAILVSREMAKRWSEQIDRQILEAMDLSEN